MRPTAIAALLLLTAFAGCADTANEPLETDDEDPNGSGADVSAGAGGGEGNNTAPTANLTASVVNGTAPLNVTFTLTGSDADGDNLTWTLVTNGTELANGSSLPATVDHVFDAGSFAVDLTVSDGMAESTARVDIDAAAGSATSPQVPETITLTGTVSGASVGGIPGSTDTQTFHWVGAPRAMTFHMEHDSVAGVPEVDHDLDWSWTGPGGISGGAAAYYGEEDDVTFDDPSEGEWSITMEKYSGPGDTAYTVTITFT